MKQPGLRLLQDMDEKRLRTTIHSAPLADNVFRKLLLFTGAIIFSPLVTYYLALNYVFEGNNTTYAGISAVVVVNIVLVAYILMAVFEDASESTQQNIKAD